MHRQPLTPHFALLACHGPLPFERIWCRSSPVACGGPFPDPLSMGEPSGFLSFLHSFFLSWPSASLLKQLGLLDAAQSATATPDGFVEDTMRALRVLTAPASRLALAQGKDGDRGVPAPSSLEDARRLAEARTEGELNERANRVLARALEAYLRSLPSSLQEDEAAIRSARTSGDGASNRHLLALRFRRCKKLVLTRCLEVLRAQTAAPPLEMVS